MHQVQESPVARGSLLYVIGISLVAVLGGLLFGFNMIVVSGTIKSTTAIFKLEDFWLGWATSCRVFGCIPSAALAGTLAGRFGRKKVLLGNAVLFTVSAVGLAGPVPSASSSSTGSSAA